MPQCGCFHEYELKPGGLSRYDLAVYLDGTANLKEILEKAALCQVISANINTKWWDGISTQHIFTLSGVKNEAELRGFLDLLRNRIIIDLAPSLEDCYALGPYTVFDEQGQGAKHPIGDLFYRAKYENDEEASLMLDECLKAFIASHPRLRNCGCIVAAPKGDSSTPDLAGRWAQDIAKSLGWPLARAYKVRQTDPQKELNKQESEEDAVARVADSMRVENVPQGANVLIVDDTIRSGGTIMEVARASRVAGANEVFGLSAAKDAKFRRGVTFSRELWQ